MVYGYVTILAKLKFFLFVCFKGSSPIYLEEQQFIVNNQLVLFSKEVLTCWKQQYRFTSRLFTSFRVQHVNAYDISTSIRKSKMLYLHRMLVILLSIRNLCLLNI